MKRAGVAALFVLLSLGGARAATAEPLTLTGGFVVLFDEGSDFRFEAPGVGVGTHNFAVTVPFGTIPSPECSQGAACLPGETFNFARATAPNVLLGVPGSTSELILDGQLFEDVTFFGSLNLDAPSVTLPVNGQRWRTFRVPFTLTGFLRAERNGATIWSSDIQGNGIAHSTFQMRPGSRFYQFDAPPTTFITFDLNPADPAPVPEPATMVLLGTGMLGLAAAFRRAGATRPR